VANPTDLFPCYARFELVEVGGRAPGRVCGGTSSYVDEKLTLLQGSSVINSLSELGSVEIVVDYLLGSMCRIVI